MDGTPREDEIDLSAAAKELAGVSPVEIASGLDSDSLQDLLTTLVKGYVLKREGGEDFYPVSGSITATEASVSASGILAAADLQMFELSLWNSWGRID